MAQKNQKKLVTTTFECNLVHGRFIKVSRDIIVPFDVDVLATHLRYMFINTACTFLRFDYGDSIIDIRRNKIATPYEFRVYWSF